MLRGSSRMQTLSDPSIAAADPSLAPANPSIGDAQPDLSMQPANSSNSASQPRLEPATPAILPEDRMPPSNINATPTPTLDVIANANTSSFTLGDQPQPSTQLSRAGSSIINTNAFSGITSGSLNAGGDSTGAILTTITPAQTTALGGITPMLLIGGIVGGVVIILIIGVFLLYRRGANKKSQALEKYGNPYAQHP